MIDAIIEVVHREFVGNACEVNHNVTLFEQRRPVERLRKIRKLDADNVGIFEQRGRPRCRDYRIASSCEERYEVASNKTISTCDKNPIAHLNPKLTRYAVQNCNRDIATIGYT